MKDWRLLFVLALLAFGLTACDTSGLYRVALITDGEHILKQGFDGDLIVIGGAASLPAGARLVGSAHVLGGSLEVNGEINGDVSFLNGELSLGPTARIEGDLNLGSGAYYPAPGAVIAGRVNTGTGIQIPDLPERAAPDIWARLLRAMISGSLLGITAAALMRYMPGAIERVNDAAVRHALVSGAVGLLVNVVGVSLLVTMAYTVLLIPVTLLGLFVLGAAVLYGWVGIGVSVSRLWVRLAKRPMKAPGAAFVGTLLFVLGVEMLSAIPAIGGLIGIAAALVGSGAVFLTRFGLRRFVPQALENNL